MNSFLELARKRYSVRSYLDLPVEREKIKSCLEAARLAPSACNSQPWKFIVIDQKEAKDRFCERIFSGTYRMGSFAREAPVMVAVVAEKSGFIAQVGGFLQGTNYYLIDLGIAVEHFVLQAADLGLGTCWIGWFNEKEAKKFLSLPNNKKVPVVLSLGYPKKEAGSKIRKSLEDMSCFYTQ